MEDFISMLAKKLPSQPDVDRITKDHRSKTGKELTIEYLENKVYILDRCFNKFVKKSINELQLNRFHC